MANNIKHGSSLVNKHVTHRNDFDTNIFDTRDDLRFGEIIVVNNPKDPSLYILDANGEIQKIAGSGITNYDDTEVREFISGNTEAISGLAEVKLDKNTFTAYTENIQEIINDISEDIKSVSSTTSAHTSHISSINNEISGITDNILTIESGITDLNNAIISIIGDDENEGVIQTAINDAKLIIDEYTVSGKKISENPELETSDIKLDSGYTYIETIATNILPNEILTTAIAKLEKMIANTTLALSAAINDIEFKLGAPTEYDDEGNVKQESYGVYKKIEEITKRISQLHPEDTIE